MKRKLSAEKYKLRVTAGPCYNRAGHLPVAVNTSTPSVIVTRLSPPSPPPFPPPFSSLPRPLLLTLPLTSARRHSPPPPSAIPPLSQLHPSPRHTPLLLPPIPHLRPILLPALLLANLRSLYPGRRPCLWQRLFLPGPQEPADRLQHCVEDRKMDRPGHAG